MLAYVGIVLVHTGFQNILLNSAVISSNAWHSTIGTIYCVAVHCICVFVRNINALSSQSLVQLTLSGDAYLWENVQVGPWLHSSEN